MKATNLKQKRSSSPGIFQEFQQSLPRNVRKGRSLLVSPFIKTRCLIKVSEWKWTTRVEKICSLQHSSAGWKRRFTKKKLSLNPVREQNVPPVLFC